MTFVAFFILVGNLGQIEFVRQNVADYLSGKELMASAMISQVISNVPVAIMLSTITDQVKPLLLGVNIGGLGTLVASLASLISFRIYVKSSGAVPLQYVKMLSIYNVLLLIVLLLIASIL